MSQQKKCSLINSMSEEQSGNSTTSVIEKCATIQNNIHCNAFIINSESCTLYILYLISLDVHRHFSQHLNILDDRYVEVESLQVAIHDGVYAAIEYKIISGRGYKLPRIKHNNCNG